MILKTYKSLLIEYSSGIIGYGTLGVLGQSCIGSIAAMFILMNNDLPKTPKMIELFLVTIFTMGFNGAVLSQQSGKVQFNILVASILISILFILLN
ncbi:hypothetical protein [Formosa sp. PL04]|uniref:hypothetical protein n=1 Tax=Formosa sp. PL04 TaxID=3081755 RepID=UPI002981DC24|nr:hypothetical protein [Formosa sp. PL04]MDW5288763.1 hypothetical protein [Formosa sp. PL04]